MSASTGTDAAWQQAGQEFIDLAFTQLRRMARLPALPQKVQQVRKGATPSEVVYEEDRLKVLHYLSDKPPQHRTPLVFVFALVNRPYILDILPGKSVVAHFVRAGFDTYLIDWGVPTPADRHNDFETYVNGYMRRVVDYVRGRTGSRQVNLLGYCMGGTMSTAFTALHPALIKNLVLLAAGIDFSTHGGLLSLWSDPRYFDVDALVGAYGNCPAELLQAGFLLLKPVSNLVEKPLSLWERLDDDRFVQEYLTMETWLNDNIPVPGAIYREFIKYLYQQNQLVKNRLRIGSRTVDLRQISCPLLNLVATRDDLVPCSQSEPLNELVASQDKQIIKLPAGHIGLAMGSRAQRELWPAAVRWLADRDGGQ